MDQGADAKTAGGAAGTQGLRKGYSTGTVASAAVKASIRHYFAPVLFDSISVKFPGGERRRIGVFFLEGIKLRNEAGEELLVSRAGVKKDAGDDPDVTGGIKIFADFMKVGDAPDCSGEGSLSGFYKNLHVYSIIKRRDYCVTLMASSGIGVVKKPGLPVGPGLPAINPVPRDMIEAAVREEMAEGGAAKPGAYASVLFVPDGEEVAKKTLNPRLGIEGGISILGTTGYVNPISSKAWLGTIKASLGFLKGNKISSCVFTPGRFSSSAALKILGNLPEECFIEIGDFVSYSMRKAAGCGMKKVILAGQFGKIVKVSLGIRNTNAKYHPLSVEGLSELVTRVLKGSRGIGKRTETGVTAGLVNSLAEKIRGSNTSREVFGHIESLGRGGVPFEASIPGIIINGVLKEAKKNLTSMAGEAVDIGVILISYEGKEVASV